MPHPSRLRDMAGRLSTALDRATRLGAWLVLPLALLLFAQWPLRDIVGAWSRQANDIAQWVFALYVALALREATRRRCHMAAGLFTSRPPGRWRRWTTRFGESLCVMPWAAFVLVAGAAPTWQSVANAESFPDTFNPLYFVIRCAAWLMALLMALQALADLAGDGQSSEPTDPGDEGEAR